MAISKILHMKDCGTSFHARHLKRSLDYVMNPEKTQNGRLVGAINCQVDNAFEQMMATKKLFGGGDKQIIWITGKIKDIVYKYCLCFYLIQCLAEICYYRTVNIIIC